MTTTEIVENLGPVLIWLHSKKHDEKPSGWQWRKAWEAMAYAIYPYHDRRLHLLEQAAHTAQGLAPVDVCGCQLCKSTQG